MGTGVEIEVVGRGALTKGDQFWLGHLQAIARGGESVSAYTQRNGLSSGALYQARRRLERRGAWTRRAQSVSFAPVLVRDEPTARGIALRLRLAGGVELEWSSAPDVSFLAALLERVVARA